MGSDGRAPRQNRAQEFGRLHPRLTAIIWSVVLAGGIAICAFQTRHGTYLGSGWLVAAVAGMVAAAALGPVALISNLRHRPTVDGLGIAWTVLAGGSALSLTFPFPVGRYGSVQAFLNVVHAILLGYAAVTMASLIALFAFLIIHPGSLPSRAELRQQLPRRRKTIAHGWPGWVLSGPSPDSLRASASRSPIHTLRPILRPAFSSWSRLQLQAWRSWPVCTACIAGIGPDGWPRFRRRCEAMIPAGRIRRASRAQIAVLQETVASLAGHVQRLELALAAG